MLSCEKRRKCSQKNEYCVHKVHKRCLDQTRGGHWTRLDTAQNRPNV